MSKQTKNPEPEIGLKWGRCTSDAFPHDTNLYATFEAEHHRLIGWVRELVHPDTAGFYIRPASSLFYFFPPGSIDSTHCYPTKAQAMRALRTAAIVVWIATDPEGRERFIRNKGKV